MDKRHTSRINETERLWRLKQHLGATGEDEKLVLLRRLNDCHARWEGSYKCMSPACPDCRRANVARQMRVILKRYEGVPNDEVVHVIVRLPATPHVEAIKPILRRSYDVLRKRIAAARNESEKWDCFAFNGWATIGARESTRRAATDQVAPIWLPALCGVAYVGQLGRANVDCHLQRSWRSPGQVVVRAMDHGQSPSENLAAIARQSNDFACVVEKKAKDTGASALRTPWPPEWEGALFSYLNSVQRNAFECLRMNVHQRLQGEPCIDHEWLEPMPFTCSFSENHTYDMAAMGGSYGRL